MNRDDLRRMVSHDPRAREAVERQLRDRPRIAQKASGRAVEPRGGVGSTPGPSGAVRAAGMASGASGIPLTMRVLRLTLALPPRECSPNWRGHWGTKRRAVKAYREASCLRGLSVKAFPFRRMVAATLNLHFFFSRANRRDSDNLVASFKAARDGLADAGIVKDDSAFRVGSVAVGVDKNPRLEVEIVENP